MRNTFLVLILLASNPTWGNEPYTWVVNVNHTQEDSFFAETETNSINGSYFWRAVETSKGPLGEAEFLSRASGVSIRVNDRNVDPDTDVAFLFQSVINPGLSVVLQPGFINVDQIPVIPASFAFSPSPSLTHPQWCQNCRHPKKP